MVFPRTTRSPAVARMRALRAAAVVGGFAQSLTGAAGSLLAFEVAGSASAAGLPQTALVAGAALAAAVSSRLAVTLGRRATLTGGALTATTGSIVVAAAAATASLALVLAGCVLLGAGSATVMLGRYAAAELVPESRRAKAMASVLGATTIGAVAGPNLLGPADAAASALGLPGLGGPFLLGAVGFALAAAVLATGLRGGRPTAPEPAAQAHAAAKSALPGLAVLSLSNLVMVAVMTMAPVQIGHAGGGLGFIGLVISVHVAGMFAPSPISARLTSRLGAARTAALSGATMGAACALAASGSHAAPVMAIAMAALGVGWNLGLVSGSAMLTASVPTRARARREGMGEVGMGVAAATGGLACGPVVAAGGYGALALGGATLAIAMAALVSRVDRNARLCENGPNPCRTIRSHPHAPQIDRHRHPQRRPETDDSRTATS